MTLGFVSNSYYSERQPRSCIINILQKMVSWAWRQYSGVHGIHGQRLIHLYPEKLRACRANRSSSISVSSVSSNLTSWNKEKAE